MLLQGFSEEANCVRDYYSDSFYLLPQPKPETLKALTVIVLVKKCTGAKAGKVIGKCLIILYYYTASIMFNSVVVIRLVTSTLVGFCRF